MPEGSFSRFARRFYRSYRNGRIRIGHSFVKRAIAPFIPQQQEIRLRSGLKMALDHSKGNQAGIFWSDGDEDVALAWAIRELVPVGGVFVDCGANCGLMGLLAAQYRHARTIFIEPHPRLARTIEANLQLNHFAARAELIEAAVSDTSGEVTFYESPAGDDGTHSIHADWQAENRVLGKVRCRTLAEIIKERQLALVDFLKIDTEGNDFPVLKSLAEYLNPSFVRLIHVEMTRNAESIFKLMTDCGYVGFTTRAQRGTVQAQKFQAYERGGQVCFFHPLRTASEHGHNALWCGQDSGVACYLNELHRLHEE